jgi:hypothetical protein
MEFFGGSMSPLGGTLNDPTGEFSTDYFEEFSIGLDIGI